MILKRLVLENFRSFLGTHEVTFSDDKERNITLIHGENGTGKTTLLNSILWCLFGEFTENFKMKEDLLSHDASDLGVDGYKVEVFFEWEGMDYRVIRSGGAKSSFEVNQIEDGIQMPLPSPVAFINSILPRDMAGYFFFAGEGISQISQTKNKSKFRKAIRDILGFTFAEAAVDDLGFVSRQFSKVLTELTRGKNKLKEAAESKAQAEDEISELEVKMKNLESSYQALQAEQDVIDAKVAKFSVYNVSDLQRKESKLVQEIKSARGKADEFKKEKRRLVQRYGWAVFGSGISDLVSEYIDLNTLKATIPSPYDESFVNKILETAICICGREIEKGSDCETSVRSLIVKASSGELQQRVHKARSVSDKIRGVAKEFINEVERLDKDVRRNEALIGELERDFDMVRSDLDRVPVDEIKKLRSEKSSIESRKVQANQKIGAIKLRLIELKSDLERFKKVLEQESSTDSRVSSLLRSQEIIQAMISRCQDRLSEQERSSRDAIESEINDVLTEFSRKDYRVELDESFNLSLLRANGTETGYSDGEELLLNLSFVCALILHAKARQSVNDGFLVGGTVAPFVVDAPFGDLDNTYKGATAGYLPHSAPQLVLLLSSSHWAGAVDEAIRGKVGKEYVLVSHRKVAKGARPDDEIEVGGKVIKQSLYDQKSDFTSVVEVK